MPMAISRQRGVRRSRNSRSMQKCLNSSPCASRMIAPASASASTSSRCSYQPIASASSVSEEHSRANVRVWWESSSGGSWYWSKPTPASCHTSVRGRWALGARRLALRALSGCAALTSALQSLAPTPLAHVLEHHDRSVDAALGVDGGLRPNPQEHVLAADPRENVNAVHDFAGERTHGRKVLARHAQTGGDSRSELVDPDLGGAARSALQPDQVASRRVGVRHAEARVECDDGRLHGLQQGVQEIAALAPPQDGAATHAGRALQGHGGIVQPVMPQRNTAHGGSSARVLLRGISASPSHVGDLQLAFFVPSRATASCMVWFPQIATATSCALVWTSSFDIALRTWLRTVSGEMCSSAAISFVSRPRAISVTTSRSRVVSGSSEASR